MNGSLTRVLKLLIILQFFIGSCDVKKEQEVNDLTEINIQASSTVSVSPTVVFTSTPELVSTPTPVSSNLDDNCIGTFEEFVYQMVPNGPWEKPPKSVPYPKYPWEEVTILPSPLSNGAYRNYWVFIAAARPTETGNEIWLQQRQDDYLVYQSNREEFFRVSSAPSDSKGNEETLVYVGELFVTSSGDLWGRNYLYDDMLSQKDIVPLFSKYNPTDKRFELDYDGILVEYSSLRMGLGEDYYPGIIVEQDHENNFWIFHPDKGLFQYIINNGTTEYHKEFQDLKVNQVSISREGVIFVTIKDAWGDASLDEDELFQYDPKARNLISLTTPIFPMPDTGGLLVTQNGDLWIGIHGYMSLDGSWHLMNPNPLDYIYYGRTAYTYNWAIPDLVFESSDGLLWFENDASETIGIDGMAWFDPVKGEGCWFVNNGSKIVEDQNQSLWILIKGKLYRKSVE